MKAVLLNARRLNFDGQLSFHPIESVVDLVCHNATDPGEAIARAKGFEILITKELKLSDLIQTLPEEVRLICEAGTGFDNIAGDKNVGLAEAARRRITVCNVPHYSTHAVAQLTIMFILALNTGLPRLIRDVEKRDLIDWAHPSHYETCGKTLGVIGAGAIGQEVIRLARALGMTVRVTSKSPHTWADKEIQQVDLPELLAQSHFVSLHVPLNDDTTKLIGAKNLALMRPGAYLINTSRGGLVDHVELADVLESGRLSGAALDVQEPEPLGNDHVLWTKENVILTPHLGWKALESRRRLIDTVAANIQAFVKNEPINVVKGSFRPANGASQAPTP